MTRHFPLRSLTEVKSKQAALLAEGAKAHSNMVQQEHDRCVRQHKDDGQEPEQQSGGGESVRIRHLPCPPCTQNIPSAEVDFIYVA